MSNAFDEWLQAIRKNGEAMSLSSIGQIGIAKAAFNAGMTRAAEICKSEKVSDESARSNDEDFAYNSACDHCTEAIEKARDGND